MPPPPSVPLSVGASDPPPSPPQSDFDRARAFAAEDSGAAALLIGLGSGGAALLVAALVGLLLCWSRASYVRGAQVMPKRPPPKVITAVTAVKTTNGDSKGSHARVPPPEEHSRLESVFSHVAEGGGNGVLPRLVKAWSSLERPRIDAQRSFAKLEEERLALKTPPTPSSGKEAEAEMVRAESVLHTV